MTPDGKVDYARLAERRERLAGVVARLAAASPESHPERFPSAEDRLAYWINAYDVFTVDAILAEYPIASVWRTREGQFFQRRRHVAGGRAVRAGVGANVRVPDVLTICQGYRSYSDTVMPNLVRLGLVTERTEARYRARGMTVGSHLRPRSSLPIVA